MTIFPDNSDQYGLVKRLFGTVVLLSLATSVCAAEPADVLPAGPTQILSDLAETASVTLGTALASGYASGDWVAAMQGMGADLDENALATLADYLAINITADPAETDATVLVAQLPSDGRSLFVENCLSCHGAGRYYLGNDMDVTGWLDIFSAPYHRRLLTETGQRETFASYAAIMMPIEGVEVPDEWQDNKE